MPKGTMYSPERGIWKDPDTGTRIIRLSHSSTISTNLYFEMCSFSKEDSHVIFASQRYASRDAPWDLFRVQTDGIELVQITEHDGLRGVVVCPARDLIFFQTGSHLIQMGLYSLQEEIIATIPGDPIEEGFSLGTIDREGKSYYANCKTSPSGMNLFRVNLQTGDIATLYHSERQNHIHVDPTDALIAFNDFPDNTGKGALIQTDGTLLRPSGFEAFAHHTWFGDTQRMQGTLLPPGKALALRGEGDEDFEILAEGPYFWHSGVSLDAQWIVSDTNWPQQGIFLLHVPTGKLEKICNPGNSPSHPQWTHPHPSLSNHLKYVLYNSDATGIGQVYLAELQVT